MNEQSKNKIKELTRQKIELAGSQNKYARSLGVSEGTMSYLMNDQWDKLSAEMWRKLAEGCSYSEESWQVVSTASAKRIINLLNDAKQYANVFALVGAAGSGKSEMAKQYANSAANVYRVECAEYFNKKTFLAELLKAMGINGAGLTVFEMMESIQTELLRVDKPLIILDEADKLRDEVLYFFITLYNRLEDKCGLMMCATEYLKNRVQKGVRLNRKGYNELFSRIGRRFVEFPAVSGTDIALICQANGISHSKTIQDIIEDCDHDLRRVKRLIHKNRRQGKEVAA